MAFYYNTGEGGSNGLAASISNTGGTSGDAFTLVTTAGTTSIQYLDAAGLHGTRGYRFTPDASSTNQVYLGYTFTGGLKLITSTRFYFRFSALPNAGGAATLCYWANTANTAQRCQLVVNPAGVLTIQNAVGTGVFSSSSNLAINTIYRAECALNITTGAITLRVFAGESTSPIAGFTANLTGQSIGSPNGAASIWFGYRIITGGAGVLDMDEIAVDDSTIDLLGPVTAYEIPMTSTSLGSGTVQVAWTHPADAPSGVSVARAPGIQTTDANARPVHHPLYNPMTISGATVLASGRTSSPYLDTGVAVGSWTYWVVRTT